MTKANILDVIDGLNFALNKVEDFDVLDVELSDRVFDNRVITLEGYFKFLESEGIPKIRRIYDSLEGDYE
jgi:hypothetical protein